MSDSLPDEDFELGTRYFVVVYTCESTGYKYETPVPHSYFRREQAIDEARKLFVSIVESGGKILKNGWLIRRNGVSGHPEVVMIAISEVRVSAVMAVGASVNYNY